MDVLVLILVFCEQLQAPLDHLLLGHGVNDGISHHFIKLGCVLCTHLLEDGEKEPLSDTAVLLLFKNTDDFLEYLKV